MGAVKTIVRVLACLLLFGQAQAHALTLTLMWDPSIDPGVVGYRVSYGTASGSYNVQVDAGNTSSVVVNNLDDQTAYYFIVQAYDFGQAHFSIPSSEVAYRPLSMSCRDASAI